MAHPMDTCYVLAYIPDGFTWPSSFKGAGNIDQSGTYEIHDDQSEKTAENQGYTTAHVFPTWITDICPNAPDCRYSDDGGGGDTRTTR